MSYYDDRRPATRDRRRGDDDYYDDTAYTNTRENLRSTAVIKRRSDSPEYDEEIRRDFSPGGGGYYRETTIRKSGTRPAGRARSYEEDRRYDDDRSLASSRRDSYYGARRRGYDDRLRGGRSRRDNYSDDSSRSRSRSRAPKRERRKSMPEEALAALGLGGLVAKLTGKSRSRSSSRDRDGRARSRSGRDRSGSEHRKEQLQQALKAAVLAGAGAAFRARHEDGGWNGEKGKRVLTAALTAGGVDGFINRDKDPEKHKFRDTIGAAVAGIATDRLVHGPRSRSRGPDGRRISPDRGSRSRSRSKVGDLLAGGGAAIAAKKLMDSVRGRSQSRGRDRGRSRSRSYDSRDDSRSPPRRSRSRSVIASGLSKLGLDKQADKVDPVGARERSRSRGPGRNRNSSRSRYADDDYVDDHDRRSPYDPPNYGRGSMYDNRDVSKDPNPSSRSYSRSRALDPDSGALINRPHSVGPGGGVLSPPGEDYAYDTGPRHNGDPETDSDSDLGSSSDDENMKKKSRKRLALSGGLATVATIHAGHSVYQSMEKRKARKRALKNGMIDKEEAAKHKSRDRLQDAASIGLATLGIKGAYSEWKDMKEQNDEWNEELEKRKRHARKREARRQKMSLVGMSHGEAGSSAPTFTEPYYGGGGPHEQFGRRHGHGQGWQGGQPRYDGRGPYMSGANGGSMGQQGQGPMNETNHNNMQYYDDNPYGWIGRQGNAEQQQGYNGAGGGPHYGNGNSTGNPNYPSPAQGGTGFPPPPGSQPPPSQAR